MAAHDAPVTVPPRAPYAAPRLEALGAWQALTLQQSVTLVALGALPGPPPPG